jgi:hypothetical protein
MPGATSRMRARRAGMIRISMLSGNPNLNVRTAVAGSKAWSRDTSASTCTSMVRTGSSNVTARGVRRMPSEPRVRSSSSNNSRSRARL